MFGWLKVVGCWLLVVGCWLLVVGCWLFGCLFVGCWLLVVGCRLFVIGYWWLVVGYLFVENKGSNRKLRKLEKTM